MKCATYSGFPNPTFFFDDGVSGAKLYFYIFSSKQDHYVCSNYKSNTGTCSARFIREETLKKIIVHAPDKSSGHRRQKIELVWNFIREVNLSGDDQAAERQRKGRTARPFSHAALRQFNYFLIGARLVRQLFSFALSLWYIF